MGRPHMVITRFFTAMVLASSISVSMYSTRGRGQMSLNSYLSPPNSPPSSAAMNIAMVIVLPLPACPVMAWMPPSGANFTPCHESVYRGASYALAKSSR